MRVRDISAQGAPPLVADPCGFSVVRMMTDSQKSAKSRPPFSLLYPVDSNYCLNLVVLAVVLVAIDLNSEMDSGVLLHLVRCQQRDHGPPLAGHPTSKISVSIIATTYYVVVHSGTNRVHLRDTAYE